MKDAADWIEQYRDFWEVRLDALARYLEETSGEQVTDEPTQHRKDEP